MELSALTAISPIDGRYRRVTWPLETYFSEASLFKYRTLIEIEYFIALCELPLPQLADFDTSLFPTLRAMYENFTTEDAQAIKEIEKITNHDVKAVEYFIKEKLKDIVPPSSLEFIHFGLTSQDINNTAVPLSIKDALVAIIFPAIEEVIAKLKELVQEWKNVSMLAKTHGQPASPTNLGKELYVFVERLEIQFSQIKSVPHSAKFGGATGNFNAHKVSYPEIGWVDFANNFVNNKLHLNRSQTTTQIEHYDNIAALCDGFKRINNILMDLGRDIWTYISMGY
ncbi:MAG: adenylosuccinate lyase, partial [Flavobacteriales bacterium]|nr:adenylosuccinate lyase [Flavobacteriales bacterium]